MFLILLTSAFAAPPPPIVNGQLTSDFIEVGVIMAYYEGYGGAPFCSGTLVHEEWVTTAAHCVEAVDEYAVQGYDIYFLLGNNLYTDSGTVYYDTVGDWISHPDYSGTQTNLIGDIGLLRLSTGIPEVTPAPLNEEIPDVTWQGEYLDYVGWGITSDNAEDSGVKRTTQIPYYQADDYFIYSYDPNTNLCSGDSGGAALREVDGEFVLVGVNSFVFQVEGSNPCVGGASGATRIDYYLDWIREYVPEPEPEPVQEEDTGIEDEEAKLFGCASTNGSFPLWVGCLGLFTLRRKNR